MQLAVKIIVGLIFGAFLFAMGFVVYTWAKTQIYEYKKQHPMEEKVENKMDKIVDGNYCPNCGKKV
jgi:hypothetical protein